MQNPSTTQVVGGFCFVESERLYLKNRDLNSEGINRLLWGNDELIFEDNNHIFQSVSTLFFAAQSVDFVICSALKCGRNKELYIVIINIFQ